MAKKYFGFFFGKKTSADKIKEMIPVLMEHLPEIKKLLRAAIQNEAIGISGDIGAAPSDGERLGKMYDFFVDYHGTIPNANGFVTTGIGGANVTFPVTTTAWTQQVNGLEPVEAPVVQAGVVVKKDAKVFVKPAAVLGELETIPTPVRMEELDTKIATFKDKTKLPSQHYAQEQIKAMIKRLENRKKYPDHVAFFSQFPNTNDEHIETLLSKYKLVMKKSDLFIPTLPKEAIDIMTEYEKITVEISGEKPNFYVIAEETDFEKKVKKLDPILLVQSPFGFFWQILGAWDKEILLLSEL